MKVSWVVIFNRLFEVINQPGDCYFSGPRFISKVRQIDPYFPDYHQFLNDRNKTGKSTSRKSYFYDILLSFGEEERVRLLNAILKEVESAAGEKVREIRSLVHGIALAPSALAATSNSSTCGRVKLPHPRRRDGGLYSTVTRFATRAAASFSRQLLPSNFSRWPWCIRRSRSGVTTTASPSSGAQSSKGRFEVTMVEAFS